MSDRRQLGQYQESIKKRFDELYIPVTESGCWILIGSLNKQGYGRMYAYAKTIRAHRFSYEHFIGKIEAGLCCLHRCDVRSCVNPEHLFLGTRTDNSKDMVAKDRQRRGEGRPDSKLKDRDVHAILEDIRPHRFIAHQYNISSSLVHRIKAGKCWKHLSVSNQMNLEGAQ